MVLCVLLFESPPEDYHRNFHVVVVEPRNRIAKRSVNCKRCRFVVTYKFLIKGGFVTSIPFHFRKNWMVICLDEDRGYFIKRYHIYPTLSIPYCEIALCSLDSNPFRALSHIIKLILCKLAARCPVRGA